MSTAEIIHANPSGDRGDFPCCGRTPFEVADADRMTVDDALVNCGRRGAMAAVLLQHREQRMAHAAETLGCSCGWCPSGKAEASLLTQYVQHVASELEAVSS